MKKDLIYIGEGGQTFNPKVDGPLRPTLTSPAIGAHLPMKEA